jgi:hypothetical protein
VAVFAKKELVSNDVALIKAALLVALIKSASLFV